MREVLIDKLPTERIASDVTSLIAEDGGKVELDGRDVEVPDTTPIDVVTRSFHAYEVEMSFGDHFRVLVAVGGIVSVEHGVPKASICFATLWYSNDGNLITADFSATMP